MFSDRNHSRTYLLFSTIDGAPIFWSLIYDRVLEKKYKLKTNSFCKERPNTWHYCIILVFDQKLFKNIPLPLGQTMNSLVSPWQISFVTCRRSLQFFDATTSLSIFSFALNLSTWSFFLSPMPWASCVFFKVDRLLHLKNLKRTKRKFNYLWHN